MAEPSRPAPFAPSGRLPSRTAPSPIATARTGALTGRGALAPEAGMIAADPCRRLAALQIDESRREAVSAGGPPAVRRPG